MLRDGVSLKNWQREICIITGGILIGIGLWLIYPPLSLVTIGSGIIYIGLPPRDKKDVK